MVLVTKFGIDYYSPESNRPANQPVRVGEWLLLSLRYIFSTVSLLLGKHLVSVCRQLSIFHANCR